MARQQKTVVRLFLALAACASIFSTSARALEPKQIALIINSNVPESRKLAEFYATQRHIPLEQIIELSLSASKDPLHPLEDLTPEEYDARVVPVVRDFLMKSGMDQRITCLVTFWGVPLRVDARSSGEGEKKELADLKAQIEVVRHDLEAQVKSAEALAASVDSTFHPGSATDLDALGRRAEVSITCILTRVVKMAPTPERTSAYEGVMGMIRDIAGTPAVTEKTSQPDFWPIAAKQPTTAEILANREHTAELLKKINALQAGPQTVETRAALRELFKSELGSINLARLIVAQTRATDTAESESAFDSELALLWWPAYPKARWTLNPLNFHYTHIQLPSHTLMVMRLDGPTQQSVHDLIETSIKVEHDGLKGQVLIDARGKPPTEPYGVYDQTLRNLNEILTKKTSLKVLLDNKEPLIPENSEKDIAVYCGWYSLRHYVCPGEFNPGAVAFHVASSEMVSLHNPKETGWCRGLMNAGVVATLGPVAEPYLQSFPPADEFFPLLMTGKLTLAEVYWKTAPWTSWMQCCVGDPLYTPYKVNPPLKVEDLPEALKPLVP